MSGSGDSAWDGRYSQPPPAVAGKFLEGAGVQQPALYLLDSLGWGAPHTLIGEGPAGAALAGRANLREVILTGRLAPALGRLNPGLPATALQRAIDILTEDRRAMPPQDAAREFHRLIRDGVRVKARNEKGQDETLTVRVIDWRDPAANDFFLTEEFWVQGDLYKRRADVVGFVNGIPLLHMELKAPTEATKAAFDGNLATYLTDIPQFFTPNGLVILSNGLETKVGAAFTPWDRFAQWKRVNSEADAPKTDLETTIRAVAAPARLLDIVENFTVFEATRDGTIKKIAQNHQYLGVKNAVEAVRGIAQNQGRLGVFWHTQGSGKSLSMAYFAANVLRHLEGGWTFVVVTDRTELDGQIYKTFRAVDLVNEDDARAESIADLRRLLGEDHRFVFTLIHKFQTRDGSPHPVLSDRSNIIVMTDEAHRSQYDTLAMNMRAALPNAAFIGFTGTPLIDSEEQRTREVFGDYVSIYDFGQSVEDGATVPLYYESRKPELHLDEEVFEDGLNAILEAAELDEDQEKELERRFAKEYHLIVRPERLAIVAEDLADHFVARGHQGKAMMVCVDKATAVRMHDLVKARFAALAADAERQLASARDGERPDIEARLARLRGTDMAVVVSAEQNEVKRMADKGFDIVPHRKRMNDEDLEEKFKDPADPLSLVFVCAMWITGFDVPEISTVYLDKPMKNHTLMQTIARANRRAKGKQAGFIVDYIGVFRSLQKALSVYGGGTDGGGTSPIADKSALVDHLRAILIEARDFCAGAGADFAAVHAARVGDFGVLEAFKACKEALISPEVTRLTFMRHAVTVRRVFKALLPDERAGEFAADCQLIDALARSIAAQLGRPDVDAVMDQVEALLDQTISAEDYVRAGVPEGQLYDLSAIDLDALRAQFDGGEPMSAAERLAALLEERVRQLATVNPVRADLLERLRVLIDRYNTGTINIAVFFQELQTFAQGLSEEEGRGLREGLSEEELALFDILTKPDPQLTDAERDTVKAVARDFLARLKAKKLVLDWWKRPDARADVSSFLRDELNSGLPDAYEREIFERKCDAMMLHLRARYGEG